MQYGEAWKLVNALPEASGGTPYSRRPRRGDTNYADLEINDGPFTLDEFRRVKASLQLGKVAGPDNIPPEVLKSCDFDEICLKSCDKVLGVPQAWPLVPHEHHPCLKVGWPVQH